MNAERWNVEADAFVQAFLARAGRCWDTQPGDLIVGEPAASQPRADDGWDMITLLHARGKRLAKRIRRDGAVEAYEGARLFDMIEIPLAGIDMIEDDLTRLIRQPDCCIVRGKIAEIGRSRGVRRLFHQDGADRPTLIDVPRRWVCLDIDGMARPERVAAADLAACADIAIAALPPEFHDVRCLVQATASHGIKSGSHLRLWFWLDRFISNAELKRWLPADLVDHAAFSAAQVIYTAAPLFEGQPDPLPARLLRLPAGAACVAVPELPEPVPRPEPRTDSERAPLTGTAALDGILRRLGHANAGQRNSLLFWASCRFAAAVGEHVLFEDDARRHLTRAAENIGLTHKEVNATINSAFRRI